MPSILSYLKQSIRCVILPFLSFRLFQPLIKHFFYYSEVSPQLIPSVYMGVQPEDVPKVEVLGRDKFPTFPTPPPHQFKPYDIESSETSGGKQQAKSIADPHRLLFQQKRIKFALVASKQQQVRGWLK